MENPLLLWLPLAALAVLFVTGAGFTALLAPRFPLDAQAALAAPVGAAILVCAAVALHTGVSPQILIAAVLAVSVALSALLFRRAHPVVKSLLAPLAVTALVLIVVATPFVARGSWDAATIVNADPYLWVSQANSFLDGPPPQPASDHPDRIAYDRVVELHWPAGLPFALAGLSMLGSADPASVYGAFAVVLAVLLSLGVYAAARACLEWSMALSSAGAVAVGANALLLYSTFNGWQAQIALTLFGTLALFGFRIALDVESTYRERVLTGLFIAAGIATYGLVYAFFGALLAVVAIGYLVAMQPARLRRVAGVVGGVALAVVGFGAVSVIEALLYALRLDRSPASADWHGYAHGLPPEALGLIPRLATVSRPPFAWTALASIAAVGLLAFGFWAGRRAPRRDVLVATCGASVLAIGLLQLPGISPYLSLKTAAYAAPLITMLAVGGLASLSPLPRIRVATAGVAGFCALFSSAIVYQEATVHLQTLERLKPIVARAGRLPRDARVGIALRDAWAQSWAVYYLRDRPLVVLRPTEYLTGFGLDQQVAARRRYDYLLDYRRNERTTRNAELVLLRGEGDSTGFLEADRPSVRGSEQAEATR